MRTPKPNPSVDSTIENPSESGLLLCGTISQRSKRSVPVNNSSIEIVSYLVVDNNARYYYVDDFDPKQYYDVGQTVQFPVYVKPYRKKSGDPAYSLNMLKPFHPSTKGESF